MCLRRVVYLYESPPAARACTGRWVEGSPLAARARLTELANARAYKREGEERVATRARARARAVRKFCGYGVDVCGSGFEAIYKDVFGQFRKWVHW